MIHPISISPLHTTSAQAQNFYVDPHGQVERITYYGHMRPMVGHSFRFPIYGPDGTRVDRWHDSFEMVNKLQRIARFSFPINFYGCYGRSTEDDFCLINSQNKLITYCHDPQQIIEYHGSSIVINQGHNPAYRRDLEDTSNRSTDNLIANQLTKATKIIAYEEGYVILAEQGLVRWFDPITQQPTKSLIIDQNAVLIVATPDQTIVTVNSDHQVRVYPFDRSSFNIELPPLEITHICLSYNSANQVYALIGQQNFPDLLMRLI